MRFPTEAKPEPVYPVTPEQRAAWNAEDRALRDRLESERKEWTEERLAEYLSARRADVLNELAAESQRMGLYEEAKE